MRRSWVLVGLVLALLAQGGCAPAENQPFAAAAPIADPRILKPGDRMYIALTGEDEVDGEYLVQDDGMISLPLFGSIAAGGMTVATFKEHLRQRLIERAFANPVITATLVASPPPAAIASGPVMRPSESSMEPASPTPY